MKIAAIVRFWRLSHNFVTDDMAIDRIYTKLPKLPSIVEAARRRDDQNDEGGQVVAILFERSQADEDFNALIWFPTREQLDEIMRSLEKSDDATYQLRKRGWRGKYPRVMIHELM